MNKAYILGLLVCYAGIAEARSIEIINDSSTDISVKGPAKQADRLFASNKIGVGKVLKKEISDVPDALDLIFGATDSSATEVKKYSRRYTKDGVIVIKDNPAKPNDFKLYFTDNLIEGTITSLPLQ